MRPPRYPILTFHKHHLHLTHHSPSKPPPHRHTRLSSYSTAPSPTLLKTYNIPAPHLGHIRVLSLNNPRTRNAISLQLLSELSHEIDAVKREADDETAGQKAGGAVGQGTRVLILASEVDECFCAGADLKEREGMTSKETHAFLTTLRETLTTLSSLPLPTISAVSSLALGGGLELALSTTFRIFASSALVALPETRLGIIPGAGGTYRLRHLIGETRALEMAVTGRRVGGRSAGMMGICERVVEVDRGAEGGWTGGKEWKGEVRGKVLEGAVGMAREICEGGPGAVGAVMRAVREGTARAEEREYAGVLGTKDRDEALRAFAEKRKAVFKGS